MLRPAGNSASNSRHLQVLAVFTQTLADVNFYYQILKHSYVLCVENKFT